MKKVPIVITQDNKMLLVFSVGCLLSGKTALGKERYHQNKISWSLPTKAGITNKVSKQHVVSSSLESTQRAAGLCELNTQC